MNVIIAPSLLSADLANSGYVCRELEEASLKWLHLDIMDGAFVPNITFGAPFLACLRQSSRLFFDGHLMIEEPGRYLDAFAKAGADLLVIHLETSRHPQLLLEKIHDLGIRAGVALNPGTSFKLLRWLLPWIDLILVMGVNPGFSGQKFISQTLAKIRALRSWLNEEGWPDIAIEMDGGASAANALELAEAGANVLVSGSAFFRERDYKISLGYFSEALQGFATPQACAIHKNLLAWKIHAGGILS